MRSQESDASDTERWTWSVAWKLPLSVLGMLHGLWTENTINCQPVIIREILVSEAPCSHQKKDRGDHFQLLFPPVCLLIHPKKFP